jgi:hypothetical protein
LEGSCGSKPYQGPCSNEPSGWPSQSFFCEASDISSSNKWPSKPAQEEPAKNTDPDKKQQELEQHLAAYDQAVSYLGLD